jgi:bifunctional UDP-N-acetylglucosamine pyrophosphorylase/glucosamine-1-phosphate N-acetyltransferase
MKFSVAVLAAGLGTRMRSDKPKVLHNILGRPMIQYVIDAAKKLKPDRIVAVLNPSHGDVKEYLAGMRIEVAIQKKPLGTADAVKAAFARLKDFKGNVVIVNGDTPLIAHGTLKKFISRHEKSGAVLSVLSFNAVDPFSYGRIIRGRTGNVERIVEEKDLSGDLKDIREVNSGVYVISQKISGLLSNIRKNRKKGEYYLTDLLEIVLKKGMKADVINIGKEEEFLGVNTVADLSEVQKIVQRDVIMGLMKKGVTFHDPDSVIVHREVKIGADSIIYPRVCLEGETVIGKASTIYQGVRMVDSSVGKNVKILDNSVIERSRIDEGSSVGPFAHLRPGSDLGKRVKVGNFVEVKNSRISDGSKAAHLSYIGDTSIGRDVNIGAGTIICNYDGVKKHRTVIEDGVFIGSDTQLIAPVKIGKGAFVAAGSTITNDVPAKALAISRTRQKEYAGWSNKKTKGLKK